MPPLQTPFPLRLSGQLDPTVGRWQWLFKWLLAIPHWAVLLFLWIGFVLSTVLAGFAILLTGRYPRRIFDFNAGVLRWSWRSASIPTAPSARTNTHLSRFATT
jgi:hypothetical protein